MLKKILPLFLLATLGCVILFPLHNLQVYMTQGDLGRDLYCFKETLDGKFPYRDYWWVYGPLMPYYYAFFYGLLGVNIHSVLVGKMVLVILAGILTYLSVSVFFTPILGLAACLWFWAFNPDFTYTFNHIGGTCSLLAAVYLLFSFFKTKAVKHLYAALFFIFVLSCIKINFGLFSLIGLILALILSCLFDRDFKVLKERKFIYSCLAVLASTAAVYAALVDRLPAYYVHQCFPYLKADHPISTPLFISFSMLIKSNLANAASSWPNRLFGLILILSVVQCFYILRRPETNGGLKRGFILSMAALIIFAGLNLHEFLASGIYYRIYWVQPLWILLMFNLIGMATLRFPKIWKYLLYAVVLAVAALQIIHKSGMAQTYKTPAYFLSLPKAGIYVTNPPQWIDTVTKTTEFLSEHLSPAESFLALPYDPLYYFLLGRQSPVKELIFFEHINIKEKQERGIIKSLEEKKTNWILLSSSVNSPVIGMGVFGKTYCPVLSEYVHRHFTAAAVFGDWETAPRQAGKNHGTVILKRNNPL